MTNITKNIDIYKYNKENLLEVFKNEHISYREISKYKRHYTYFKEYLGKGKEGVQEGHNAGIIIVENDYISRSYLEDYQEHYILAYSEYDKRCKRVHFFKGELQKNKIEDEKEKMEFVNQILDDKSDAFWAGYLGYCVIRPIPRGIIGATLMRTYPNSSPNGYRHYTVTKKYNINIFGKTLSLDTLIYVEQDTIVGACATSAIYVAFHKLSDIFNTTRPNQKKISDAAGISVVSPNRKLKNKEGLRPFQMCKVIENFGLEPELQDFQEQDLHSIKAYLYAYLKMELPIILGIDIKNIGGHAITLTGYQEPKNSIPIISYATKSKGCLGLGMSGNKKTEIPLYLKGGFLKRLYAHDDQIGPFARIGFNEETNQLESAWWDPEKGVEHKRMADIFISITPLSKRLRIPFESVYRHIGNIHNIFHETIEDLDEVAWDLYLSISNQEKEKLRKDTHFDFNLHKDFLLSSLPKYIWVADFYISGFKCFKVIYDASDIDEDFSAKKVIYYSEEIKEFFHQYFSDVLNQTLIESDDEFSHEVIKRIGIKTIDLFRESVDLAKLNSSSY